jgi:hypothetical protein
VISGYMLTFGGLLLLGGRLGDAIGRKGNFSVGVAVHRKPTKPWPTGL